MSTVADELRERVARALRDAKKNLGYPGLHVGPTDHDYAQADVVLDAREAAAVERGRREAATEAYWVLREHAAAYLRAKPVQKAREEVDLAGKNTPRHAHHRGFADGYRAAAAHVAGLHGLTVDELEDEHAKGLDPRCPEHGKGTAVDGPTEAQQIAAHVTGDTHRYLSTSCLHGRHDHCRCTTSITGGDKEPGTCKWCPATCICGCHQHGEETG